MGLKSIFIWATFALVLAIPMIAALSSPLLAWRSPIYIGAGFAGILALVLLLVQPLLISGVLPGLTPRSRRAAHRWIGFTLVVLVLLHVVALWITSPPDVIDALLLRSPTPFSLWGVIAMWAIFATALLAAFRRRLRLSLHVWRRAHLSLTVTIVGGSVAHALLIDGTMETLSKSLLCALVLLAVLKMLAVLRGK